MSFHTTDLIQKLWSDENDFNTFMTDPKSYLKQEGEHLPDDLILRAYADTPTERYFVIPADQSQIPNGDDPILAAMRRTFVDPAFKSELLNNPKAAALEMGIYVPDGITIHILENKPNVINLTIPENPSISELSDADLELVAGGKLNKSKRCAIGAGSAAITCGSAAIVGAAFAFTIVTIAAAPVAGGVSAVAVGGTGIGSAVG